eukprot:TRINITY_DN77893_c0_g1_i1.p1 TRINITY_DN77893_c0_g1~~TRINITY_DN77893_c0_g1_i1.p1  ORF type:complete len:369 (-),score=36.66 TRINITY_DN77893_c0_g1_i1:53-1117(-)
MTAIIFIVFGLCCNVQALNSRSLAPHDRNIRITEDVVYGSGLTCDKRYINCTTMDLKLDVYEPAEDIVKNAFGFRPALLIVHGGGDEIGDKREGVWVGSAMFWASKGFVVFVANYRVKKHFGLYPALHGNYAELFVWSPEWPSSYPVVRDVKAAIRFIRSNQIKYRVDQNAIVVSGGSSGASAALATGVVFESDFKDEFTSVQDPTLISTNMNVSSAVSMVISHWGGAADIRLVENFDSEKRSRYGPHNVPVLDFHGTLDTSIPFSEMTDLYRAYKAGGVQFTSVELEDAGHGAWCAQPNRTGPVCTRSRPQRFHCEDNMNDYCSALDEYAFPWVVTQLRLVWEQEQHMSEDEK